MPPFAAARGCVKTQIGAFFGTKKWFKITPGEMKMRCNQNVSADFCRGSAAGSFHTDSRRVRRHAIVFPFISWDLLTKILWSHHRAFREDTRCPKWCCL